jgi:hypothetical protein
MDIVQILEELAFDMGELPREAIEAAVAKKESITPHLLNILASAQDRVEEIIEYDNYQGHLYSMYLLAQFREQRAYPLILNLLSFPGELPHAILGDVLTEDLCRILASVQDDNIEPIKRMIEDPSLNEYVRSALLSTLVVLVGAGLKARSEIIAYFKELFDYKLEKRASFIWDHLVVSACELYPEELFPMIEKAFEKQLVDSCFITLEDVGSVLTQRREVHLFNLLKKTELIDDTVTEMEKWLSTESLHSH